MSRLTALMLVSLLTSCGHAREGRSGLTLDTFIQSGRQDLRLNERLEFVFADDLYPGSVGEESFLVRDERGACPDGTLRVDGRRITFEPVLPSRPDLMDGGFRPATVYTIQLIGGLQATALQGYGGNRLTTSYRFAVRTVASDVGDAFLSENPGLPPTAFVTVSDHELPLKSQTGGRVRAGNESFLIWFDSHLDPRSVVKESFHCRWIVSGELAELPIRSVALKQEAAGAWVAVEPESELTEGEFYAVIPEHVRDLGGLCVAEGKKWLEFTAIKGN